MTLTTHLSRILATAAALSMLAAGCVADEADVDEIAANIELEDGGYDMLDEAPAFGVDNTFTELGLTGVETDVVDPLASDPEVLAMDGDAKAVAFKVTVLWGMMPPDRAATDPYQWDGALSVNRGAILARRTIRFEGRTDEVLPRADRKVVAFRSTTMPHMDGMRLLVIDPTPTATEPLVLTYTGRNGYTYSVAMRALLDGPQSEAVDENGNRIAAAAEARMVDPCEHGFIRGRWHKVADGRGRFIGRVANADGEGIGHLRGIYGQRANGNKVFFGKYINKNGVFKGIFRGTYGEGQFHGKWVTRDGEKGALGGEYRESIPGPETGGHFLGAWRELTCNVPERLRDTTGR